MEGNRLEQPEFAHANLHNARVTLFRHGTAKYEQGKVSIEEANDLTEEGRRLVVEQANRLANEIGQDEEITIWSSPMGRTLETATIIADVLRDHGFDIRLKKQVGEEDTPTTAENAIRVFEALEEVRGLDIDLFSALVNGGSYTFSNGSTISFDKNKTNPNNLSFQDTSVQ